MRRFVVCVSLLIGMPCGLRGQSPPPGGEKFQVITFTVEPRHAAAFEDAIQMIVEAARRARLAPEYAWRLWTNEYTYRLVSQIPNMAYFDDPELWVRQFSGTRGEALLERGMTELDSLPSQITMNEVFEGVPAWDYVPVAAAEPRYVDVREFWLRPGQHNLAAFDSLSTALVDLYQDVGFAYTVRGYRVLLGAVARLVVMTYYESRSDYMSERSLDATAALAGARHRLDELQAGIEQLLLRTNRFEEVYRPSLSYVPYPF